MHEWAVPAGQGASQMPGPRSFSVSEGLPSHIRPLGLHSPCLSARSWGGGRPGMKVWVSPGRVRICPTDGPESQELGLGWLSVETQTWQGHSLGPRAIPGPEVPGEFGHRRCESGREQAQDAVRTRMQWPWQVGSMGGDRGRCSPWNSRLEWRERSRCCAQLSLLPAWPHAAQDCLGIQRWST